MAKKKRYVKRKDELSANDFQNQKRFLIIVGFITVLLMTILFFIYKNMIV
jgi:DMSO/TMAO reductase YedYZ heme-binding membrane subunit